MCPCVFLQLSHDESETLPLHLYVKSYGKYIDSKLQGGRGLGAGGRLGWGPRQAVGWGRAGLWAGWGGGPGGAGTGRGALLIAGCSLRSDPL